MSFAYRLNRRMEFVRREGVEQLLKYYKFSYNLNASHSFNYEKEESHSHSFAIVLYIEIKDGRQFLSFDQVENIMNQHIEPLRGTYLNELPMFQNVVPTIENIGGYLFDELTNCIPEEFELIQLEISETPLRIYSISNRLILPGITQMRNKEA